ncbi:hypothetical protein J8281_16080 [Aquimarina sp. U1-2]|uniref:hypothetical protein n=1 Tax=Aquimarina sp. U1-2 TaxID=2823141 RepID=UPI001AEC9647|nr:hypothetical protein [Aquimarina sp. U1-2]MBP2833714.1 hypothetical protein [Aquimarina sp. U1-2]
MKTLIKVTILVTMKLIGQWVQAQDIENSAEIQKLALEREKIINTEKQALKKEVEAINQQLDDNEITLQEAQSLKEKAAKIRALNIENRMAIIDNKIALLERNGLDYQNTKDSKIWIGLGAKDQENADVLFGVKVNSGKKQKIKYDRRTTSGLMVAFGLNNVLVDDQSLEDSDYKIAGSRFFEIGWYWKTRVFKNSNFMRLKYGVSYTSNGLKPTDNRFFVENGNQTRLVEFPVELDKSKFRMDNIVVPVHFEFGPSIRSTTKERIRYSTDRKFKIGLGGYLGANISTRQKLKYTENGDDIKDKIKRDYNTSDLIYGISSYIGFGTMTLYAKYDVSPIFKNAVIDQNNISLGLRFDL